MVRQLPEADNDGNLYGRDKMLQQRRELDGLLGVKYWQTPLSREGQDRRPAAGPWWWEGDEEASQAFLAEMGIQLDD